MEIWDICWILTQEEIVWTNGGTLGNTNIYSNMLTFFFQKEKSEHKEQCLKIFKKLPNINTKLVIASPYYFH